MKRILSQPAAEYKDLLSKSKNPPQLYSKMQTLLSYFDEWEQNLISREETIKLSQNQRQDQKPEISQPELGEDSEFCTNEHLLNNFKQILDSKEQEIRTLQSSIAEKERIISIKNKELQEIQHIKPLSDKANTLKSKENHLKELNQDLENKKLEVIGMWDEVLLKAEQLEKKERENEARKIKLEQKQQEYELLVRKINEEKASFYQNQAGKGENEDLEKERRVEEREREIAEKSLALEEKQREFMVKTKRVYELIKTINKSLRNSNLSSLLQDDLFNDLLDGEDIKTLTEQLSSFETSFNKNNWSNQREEDMIIEETKGKDATGINNVPFFNKNDSNLLEENGSEGRNSMSFNENAEEKFTQKEAKLYLPFQGRNNFM